MDEIQPYYRRLGVGIAAFMATMYAWMEYSSVRYATCNVWTAPRMGMMLGAALLLLIVIRPSFMDTHFSDILDAIPWVRYRKTKADTPPSDS